MRTILKALFITLLFPLSVSAAKTPTMTEAKVADTYSNMKAWCTLTLIEAECPDLIKMYGLQETRLMILGITSIEAEGLSESENKKEKAYGPLHIRQILYTDYFKNNPNAEHFDHADLKKKGMERFSLRILNWYATKSGYRHCGDMYVTIRCWCGGPDGATPVDGIALDKQAAQREELEKTATYAEDFSFAYEVGMELELSGASIVM